MRERPQRVETRQSINRIAFRSRLPLGFEIMTLERLRAAAPAGVLARPLRSDFHSILLTDRGEAMHRVDFVDHRLTAGSALWIKPGQVQQFGADRPAGELAIFRPDFVIPGTHAATVINARVGPTWGPSSAGGRRSLDRARRELRSAYAEIADDGVVSVAATESLRHLLSFMILLFETPPAAPASDDLDSLFRGLLERDYLHAHDGGHYTRLLGYSGRTLNRATQRAAGESPKQAIDRRVALEARRLLAHTDRPVRTIARDVGFADASNFATFFARHTGESPTRFRVRERG